MKRLKHHYAGREVKRVDVRDDGYEPRKATIFFTDGTSISFEASTVNYDQYSASPALVIEEA